MTRILHSTSSLCVSLPRTLPPFFILLSLPLFHLSSLLLFFLSLLIFYVWHSNSVAEMREYGGGFFLFVTHKPSHFHSSVQGSKGIAPTVTGESDGVMTSKQETLREKLWLYRCTFHTVDADSQTLKAIH